jgi:hypothetical protein
MKWNMLVDSEVLALSVPEQFMEFSDAYMDSACRLCTVLALSSRKASYSRGSVVVYLAYHATELFLKGAILHKSPNENISNTHDVRDLYNRYKKLYPKKKYDTGLLFRSEEPDYSGIEPNVVKEIKIEINRLEKSNPIDQRTRYPQNKEGTPWDGVHGFEASSFLNELKRVRAEFLEISRLIFN